MILWRYATFQVFTAEKNVDCDIQLSPAIIGPSQGCGLIFNCPSLLPGQASKHGKLSKSNALSEI
jgi:hypothetical protein